MNSKRREKKQAEASGTKLVTVDLETYSRMPLPEFIMQYKTRADFPTVSDHASNLQLATYASAAAFHNASIHDTMERADMLHWGIGDAVHGACKYKLLCWDEAAELGTEAHRRLEEYSRHDVKWVTRYNEIAETNTIVDADYAALEARTMAWYGERLEREFERACYGVVNHGLNKPLDLGTEPAMSTSRITITKMTGN